MSTGRLQNEARGAELEDDDDQLRRRLRSFAVLSISLGAMAIAIRWVAVLPTWYRFFASGPLVTAATIGVAMGLATTAVRLSRGGLLAVDFLGTVGLALAYGAWGSRLAWTPSLVGPDAPPDPRTVSLVVLVSVNYVVFARAATVPSSGRWTALVTSVSFLGLLPAAIQERAATGIPLGAPLAWWALSVTLTAQMSTTIFGLRRQVKAATQLGPYRLVARLGQGGMGVVYRAKHGMLQRDTALKVLPRKRMGQESLVRFEREVRLTAKLSHPNTVTVFDYGRTKEGLFYYTMELLDGATLEHVVSQTGTLPVGRVIHILRQVAGALAEAHAMGLVHRDVKPANIMLCERGGVADVVKVLDFGLVRDIRDVAEIPASGVRSVSESGDALVGTPLFMAPEAILTPSDVTSAADIYGLGAVAYYLLTGAPPFRGATLVEVCAQACHSSPEPPSLRARQPIPAELDALVLACLAKDPGARPSAHALGDTLSELPIGGWSEADGRSWWEQHGRRLRGTANALGPEDHSVLHPASGKERARDTNAQPPLHEILARGRSLVGRWVAALVGELGARETVDGLPESIAVVDQDGTILSVNAAWKRFGKANGGSETVGLNYLDVCREAAAKDEHAQRALRGLVAVLEGRRHEFSMLYPCRSTEGELWFHLHISPRGKESGGATLRHADVTDLVAPQARLASARRARDVRDVRDEEEQAS